MSNAADLDNAIRQVRAKRVKLDVDDVVRRYTSGASATDVATALGTSAETIRRRLRERGVMRSASENGKRLAQTDAGIAQMRAAQKLAIEARRRTDLTASRGEIVQAYLGGESAKSICNRYDTCWDTIVSILTTAGIDIRDKSAAGVVRASKIPDDVKAEFYARVADKNRGRIKPVPSVVDTATTKHCRMSQRIGVGEQEVADRLRAEGFDVDRQVAVGRYNVDVAASGVAVEIHTATHGPHLGRGIIHRRVDHLTDAGWRVLYAWCPRGISPADLEQIVAHVQRLRLNPATPGEYTVLRCQGHRRPRRGANRYKGAFEVSTRQVADARG